MTYTCEKCGAVNPVMVGQEAQVCSDCHWSTRVVSAPVYDPDDVSGFIRGAEIVAEADAKDQRIRDLEREVERLKRIADEFTSTDSLLAGQADRADAERFRWLVERFANGALLSDAVLLMVALGYANEDIRTLIDSDMAKEGE